jgi:DTW domain-containing protein YfiP
VRYRASIDRLVEEIMALEVGKMTLEEFNVVFKAAPKEERFALISKRRLAVRVRHAHDRQLCMYCWMPRPVCICHHVPNLGPVLGAAGAPVMIFHAEEFLRLSNTGHIGGLLYDAAVIVEGYPPHDVLLQNFQDNPMVGLATPGPDEAMAATQSVVLFPSTDATMAADASREAAKQGKSLVLGLLDATWNQAGSINRRIAADVPRVAISIASDYASLFAPLRDQTRDTGVSTLEATCLTLEQVLSGQGREADGVALRERSVQAMKLFVDVVRIQKCVAPVYLEETKAVIAELRPKLNDFNIGVTHGIQDAAIVAERQAALDSGDGPAKHLRAPPVLNYCYCCAAYVGWTRMDLHVRGGKHQTLFYKEGSLGWEPTPASAKHFKLIPRAGVAADDHAAESTEVFQEGDETAQRSLPQPR